MAWGKEWSAPVFPKQMMLEHDKEIKDYIDLYGTEINPVALGIKQKEYNNLPPTHDPYTNPNAQIYYQCACGAILDPGTKSFAALNNAASNTGWKVRWGETSYQPYCVECGKDVE